MPCCPYARTNPSVPSSARPPATQCIFMRYSEYSSIAAGREGHMGARVAVAGASGYAGGELLRLLTGHPDLEIGPLAANSSAGQPVTAAHPQLTGYPGLDDAVFAGPDPDLLAGADLLFTALPHGESAQLAARLPDHLRVIDLGADQGGRARLLRHGVDPRAGPAPGRRPGRPGRHRDRGRLRHVRRGPRSTARPAGHRGHGVDVRLPGRRHAPAYPGDRAEH